MQKQDFNKDKFSIPPSNLYDPTEKGQFSNLTGKAIADFLSKRIDGSLYTVNYEAEMKLRKMSLNASRPDLIAYTQNSKFAIEAKGYSRGCGNMISHKNQSMTGGIPVNYSIACVSYNLYNKIKSKYHDPFNDDVPYDFEILNKLMRQYYSGLTGFLNAKYFDYEEFEENDERFFAIDLSLKKFEKLFKTEPPFSPFHFFELFDIYKPQIILPYNITSYIDGGIPEDIKPFKFEISNQYNTYIDNDRVGLRLKK